MGRGRSNHYGEKSELLLHPADFEPLFESMREFYQATRAIWGSNHHLNVARTNSAMPINDLPQVVPLATIPRGWSIWIGVDDGPDLQPIASAVYMEAGPATKAYYYPQIASQGGALPAARPSTEPTRSRRRGWRWW